MGRRPAWGLRVAAAGLVTAVAAVQLVLLFRPWERVTRTSIVSVESLIGALYMGPDYNVTGSQRAAMLDSALDTESSVRSGLEYIDRGAWPIAFLAGLVALGIGGSVLPRGRWANLACGAAFAFAIAALAVEVEGTFLRHLFDGPSRSFTASARAFFAAETILGLAAVLLLVVWIVEMVCERSHA